MGLRLWIPALVVLAACGREEPIAPAKQAPFLVSADWLRAHRDEVVVVDMQSKPELYEKGHLAGAVYAHVEDFRDDRKNLAPVDQLVRTLGGLGIDENTWVVAYDEKQGRNAGYLWYVLHQLGHGQVSLLDGHMKPFGDELVAGPAPKVEPKRYRNRKQPAGVVDIAWVKENLGSHTFLDARPPGQYSGEKPKKGMQGGHLPGALNVYWPGLLREDGTYLDAEATRAWLTERMGAAVAAGKPLVLYCNSYHDASSLQFHLARAGLTEVLVFDEGMKWGEKTDLPRRVGGEP